MIDCKRFEKLADGWVLDNKWGIEWSPSSNERMTFDEAEEYCKKQGWRLPTIQELQSLVDYDRYNPAIDTEIFPNTKSATYWSSTAYAYNTGNAWLVFFYGGVVYHNVKTNGNYVRCVRAGQR